MCPGCADRVDQRRGRLATRAPQLFVGDPIESVLQRFEELRSTEWPTSIHVEDPQSKVIADQYLAIISNAVDYHTEHRISIERHLTRDELTLLAHRLIESGIRCDMTQKGFSIG